MKIILISIGTRGDMEPFLAIGEILKERGHKVICVFPEQFRNLAEESELEFTSLGTKFIDMLDSKYGKAAMGGTCSGLKKIIAHIKLASKLTPVNKELIRKQYEIIESLEPDRILYNGKAVYPIIWGIKNKERNILVCPMPYMHYVKGHAHIAFNYDFGQFLNKLTFSLVNFAMIITIKISLKWLKLSGKFSFGQIKTELLSNKAIYTVSPTLFPKPAYWSKNLKVVGYHERNKTTNWKPQKALLDFLEKHNKILFITFGSMLNPEPEEKTKTILKVLEHNKISAIINTAAGGLVRPELYDKDLIYFTKQIPYDWIFPKVYGVIHHGGSGTTHLAHKYGCASMIIPHIVDQFVCDTITFKLGTGPKGIKISKIHVENLEPKILAMLNDMNYKHKSELISHQMIKEDFKKELYLSIIQ
ncbi:glycosyltransferase family 1 protein [Fulvivirga sp. 29W222]|uniref:Glycosyltransferase family 1 protein n=1 Tax=Fulvivirga marina TaxID=2494733 RepID=A0A937KFH4_9BACT|nr:glycosyltransferase [Fulvivirga marina]MBL6448265.1 glycosyltransferase family 1 protein [Fulvivirga marina]